MNMANKNFENYLETESLETAIEGISARMTLSEVKQYFTETLRDTNIDRDTAKQLIIKGIMNATGDVEMLRNEYIKIIKEL